MVYSQMLFALALDRMIFGVVPGAMSIIGSSLILGSAIYVAILKEKHKEKPGPQIDASTGAPILSVNEEEQGLVAGMDSDDDEPEEAYLRSNVTTGDVMDMELTDLGVDHLRHAEAEGK
jgi:hypothetical protein